MSIFRREIKTPNNILKNLRAQRSLWSPISHTRNVSTGSFKNRANSTKKQKGQIGFTSRYTDDYKPIVT